MTTRVKHPILRLEVVGDDGTLATDHVVFCRLQRQAVRVEECCRCVNCDRIGEEPPVVECTIPGDPPALGADPDGVNTDVGNLLCRDSIVVDESVPLSEALEVLRNSGLRSVAIVDQSHVMIGLVHDTDSTRRFRRGPDEAVSAAMTTSIAVDERTPVRVALRVLAANHLREAIVISKHGVPIGVFRDVDGLDWIGKARRDVPSK